MKNNTKLVEQKSLLAKLMAAENITVEHKKIPTAAFDVKNRVLYLPILKWKPGSDTYDLFCAHEVGHALWTPEAGWHSSVSEKGKGFKSFLNVVEDARIEKKIKRKFAGARTHMIGGYRELMNEDFFGLKKMGMDVNDLGLIDRINLYTKAGTDYGIEFSEEEKEWVEKVMRTETFEDVLEVTEALYEYCKENESETDNSYDEFGDMDESDEFGEDEESEGSDGSGDESEMDDFDMNMAGDESAESDSEEDGVSGSGSEGEDSDSELNSFEKEVKDAMDKMREENESKSGDSSDDSSDKTEGKTSDGFEGGTGNPFDRQEMSGPTSLTDDNFREREEEMADMRDSVTVPNYLTFPKLNIDSFIIDYKKVHKEIGEYYVTQEGATEYGRTLLKKFKSANEKMISYMVKEFEMKKAADIHRRAYNSKKGTLDMNKIHAYKYSENLFQQITSFPEGKNHGMVMFIDWSGSMSGCMKDTIEQLVNLTMFCQKVQIPFEVFAFTDSYRDWQDEDNEEMYRRRNEIPYDTSLTGKKIANYKTNDMIISHHTKLLNLFSSRMRNRELTDAYENVLMLADAFSNRYSYYYSSSYQYFGLPNNYNLGGTPLDDTIIMSKSIIEEFKIRTKAQIVNAVFLTDGQSNRNGHYLDSTNVTRSFDRRALHIDDKASRTRTYPVSDKGHQKKETDILLEALKNSLGVNLLGFFLLSGSGRRVSGNLGYIMSSYPTEVELSQFRKDKFLIDKGTSYDELYILNVKGLEIDEVDHFDSVAAGSSKAEIRKALKKNTKNKLKNRVLLNAFIEKVA
tara:strand:+ start:287 stop:2680 length:2394 start_codon:yes stop_codon:yes gene_type:complete